ncbi:CRISPR system Cascade subunit CasE [Actinoalloteichus hoggarensis]|uniref:CRISPR-associated endoribonuclease Cse3 n=1 Tax=Actinoalloteichus hoggarensis TaxID=1470176 RepID=A0A221W737_9PSEU|nr:type I-E CRISPR-associated protein Cas6/Cse3/CasE [Actinoalloteichus hoggarensis]ASO21800.1 CRISPR-associated endoribonuclease Cse3 [Actinoalloteichus hoggarensis]MBB5922397.1 CRISPR system Cascade subunit CasE [Actinoalloteichus hoggarensis]
MFLSRLTVDVTSRNFRLDYADVHQMHRTVMSAFPDLDVQRTARQHCGALWRLDEHERGFVLLVQSRLEPKWAALPADYLAAPPDVRSLDPFLRLIAPGRKIGFRLVGNPTRAIHPPDSVSGNRGRGKPVPQRLPAKQVEWLARKGEQHGFVLPVGRDGQADVAPAPRPSLHGRTDGNKITIEPVRFDGHLVPTDVEALRAAVLGGIGRAKAYGCGLISLGPAREAG